MVAQEPGCYAEANFAAQELDCGAEANRIIFALVTAIKL